MFMKNEKRTASARGSQGLTSLASAMSLTRRIRVRIADRIKADTGVCGARMTQMGRNPLPTR
ncbi:hypothetical protein ACU21_00625 [Actinobaculum suis]|nr:hypothetical protein ACU21_00625 [Actinobaculum suis]OCA95972.1 hypothetical protein ACU20_02775 [Actinobaculum suis]